MKTGLLFFLIQNITKVWSDNGQECPHVQSSILCYFRLVDLNICHHLDSVWEIDKVVSIITGGIKFTGSCTIIQYSIFHFSTQSEV